LRQRSVVSHVRHQLVVSPSVADRPAAWGRLRRSFHTLRGSQYRQRNVLISNTVQSDSGRPCG
jgi:hypothetical protein